MTREDYKLAMSKVATLSGAISTMSSYITALEQQNAELQAAK